MQDQPQPPEEHDTAEQPPQEQGTVEQPPAPVAEPETDLGLERIVFFSDAVMAADLSARSIRFSTLRTLTAPTVYLLSLPLVLLSPYAPTVAWIAIYPLLSALLRAERRE